MYAISLRSFHDESICAYIIVPILSINVIFDLESQRRWKNDLAITAIEVLMYNIYASNFGKQLFHLSSFDKIT